MEKDIMVLELDNSELEKKLKEIISNIPKEAVRELLSTYFSYASQQHINNKDYLKISELE